MFVESPETEDEMARIGQEIDAPLMANMVEGGRTPILPAKRLAELGFAIAIYPAIGFLAAAAALERAYTHLRENGDSTALPRSESYGFAPHVRFDGISRGVGLRAAMGSARAGGRRFAASVTREVSALAENGP